ncbi:MAG: hypothetical protein IPI73_09265 [Betaproteobacteria bacterium]|nr:hypothetical protein [Betaproteobacteria bacterium]
MRQQRIDELTRRDHYYLGEQDLCYFFLEYSARHGQSFGASNALIRDLVRPESKAGFGPDVPKQRAIRRLAQAFKGALNASQIGAITFVPLPQARPRDDPQYDDRIERVLRGVAEGLDVRELIEWVGTPETGDFAGIRTGPDVLYANFRVVPALIEPAPAVIMLVGDVLTTGASFVAATRRLRQALPGVPVCGLFAARRLRDADEIPHLDG